MIKYEVIGGQLRILEGAEPSLIQNAIFRGGGHEDIPMVEADSTLVLRAVDLRLSQGCAFGI